MDVSIPANFARDNFLKRFLSNNMWKMSTKSFLKNIKKNTKNKEH